MPHELLADEWRRHEILTRKQPLEEPVQEQQPLPPEEALLGEKGQLELAVKTCSTLTKLIPQVSWTNFNLLSSRSELIFLPLELQAILALDGSGLPRALGRLAERSHLTGEMVGASTREGSFSTALRVEYLCAIQR